jgi:hypothetical protein
MADIQYVIDTFKELKPIMGRWLKKVNYENMGELDENEFSEHMDTAIKALEKQIPKKPINQSTWKACPTCKQGIAVDNKTPNPRARQYCYHCGQKLDWGTGK